MTWSTLAGDCNGRGSLRRGYKVNVADGNVLVDSIGGVGPRFIHGLKIAGGASVEEIGENTGPEGKAGGAPLEGS